MPAHISKKVGQIHQALKALVVERAWQPDEKLPTETELARRFDCSISTVSKAMALLAHEGLVERKARAGTRVLPVAGRGAGAGDADGVELDALAFIYPSAQHEGIWRTVQGFQGAAHAQDRRVVMLTTGLSEGG